MRQYETYKCNKCGNEVEVQHVGGGKLVCCGEAMECITKDLTAVNLMKAFAGESQANRKYLAFAKQADKEGLPQVARLFRAAWVMAGSFLPVWRLTLRVDLNSCR